MSGFQNAPITKGLMLATGTLSLFVALADLKPYVHLQFVPHMSRYHQYWRLLVHPLVYTNSVELLMALLTFYHLGVHVERSFGTRKFASFLLIASIVSTLSAFAIIVLFSNVGLNSLPAGSFGILGAIWYQYNRIVPSLYTLSIFGVPISNKLLTYWYPIFILLHQFPTSLVAMLPGTLFSITYTSTTPRASRIRTYRLPTHLTTLLSRLLSPLADPASSAPPRRADRVLPGEISESAAQTTARLASLTRQVRAAERVVEREQEARRRDVGMAVEALRERLLAAPAATTTAAAEAEAEQTEPPTAPVSPIVEPRQARRSRFGLGGLVDRAGEAIGLRTESPAVPGLGLGVAGDQQPGQPRAPSQQEVDAIVGMFPNMSRDAVVRALQRSNYNTALAVELLLEEST